MNPHYPLVAQRANHRCEYCHAPEVVFNFRFDVEHIVPISKDGTDMLANLALSCRSCNLLKSMHVNSIDPETQTTVELYNPREHLWETHFRVDVESWEIEGLTSVGRATVSTLKMNSDFQIEARRQWMRLGLFP